MLGLAEEKDGVRRPGHGESAFWHDELFPIVSISPMRQSDLVIHILNNASKKIVSRGQGIVLEDLTGIRNQYRKGNKQGKKSRARMNGWSFYEMRRQIEYKARFESLPVILVDPRNTSAQCSECGARLVSEENRQMYCERCDVHVDRDVNASRNILARGMRAARPWFVPNGTAVEAVKRSCLKIQGKKLVTATPVVYPPRECL